MPSPRENPFSALKGLKIERRGLDAIASRGDCKGKPRRADQRSRRRSLVSEYVNERYRDFRVKIQIRPEQALFGDAYIEEEVEQDHGQGDDDDESPDGVSKEKATCLRG